MLFNREINSEADVLSLQCAQFSFSFPSSFRLFFFFFCHGRTHICASKYTKHMLHGTAYSSTQNWCWYRARAPRSSEKTTRSREHSAKSFPEKVICLFFLLPLSFFLSFFSFLFGFGFKKEIEENRSRGRLF